MSGQMKNFLLVLFSVAVAIGSFLIVIKPNLDARATLQTDVANLKQRYADLQAKEADRAVYEAGIEQNKKKFDKILAKFPEDIQQENYINMLGNMSDDKTLAFDMSSLAFNQKQTFYVLGSGAVDATNSNGQAAAATTQANATTAAGATTEANATTAAGATTEAGATTAAGATTQANATAATGTATAATTDASSMLGQKTNMSVNYTGTYKGIKNLLAYVMRSKERMTIDQMSLTYSDEDKELSGTFSFNLYAITSADRTLKEPEINDVETGSHNIFDSSDKSSNAVDKSLSKGLDDGKDVLDNYSHYISLNPSTSDADAITIGAKNDSQTNLSSNENQVQNVTVKYFMINNKYYVSYNIGDKSYPEDFNKGTEFKPGDDAINLAILSSKRKNSKDKSGIKLVLDNETDLPLNVKVDGDDDSSPRVKISSRLGKVNVYE